MIHLTLPIPFPFIYSCPVCAQTWAVLDSPPTSEQEARWIHIQRSVACHRHASQPPWYETPGSLTDNPWGTDEEILQALPQDDLETEFWIKISEILKEVKASERSSVDQPSSEHQPATTPG